MPVLGVFLVSVTSGCSLIPDVIHKPTYHNPFPQLHKVAVVPFFNQSREPTLDGDAVAIAYANALQSVPGFEVMPVGVTKQAMNAMRFEATSAVDFQRLAKRLGVDAVIVGSVSEYEPYYPPRMAITTNWHAANPGFHPIPVGYGLPWGTADEEYIPESLVQATEFELARAQLATQTPRVQLDELDGEAVREAGVSESKQSEDSPNPELPSAWPDPTGLIPDPPTMTAPVAAPQTEPVITHTRLYDSRESEFTEKLAHTLYLQDDARLRGLQGYLSRPHDFMQFCCRLHVTETLAARGGAGKSQVVTRWPIGRYER